MLNGFGHTPIKLIEPRDMKQMKFGDYFIKNCRLILSFLDLCGETLVKIRFIGNIIPMCVCVCIYKLHGAMKSGRDWEHKSH